MESPFLLRFEVSRWCFCNRGKLGFETIVINYLLITCRGHSSPLEKKVNILRINNIWFLKSSSSSSLPVFIKIIFFLKKTVIWKKTFKGSTQFSNFYFLIGKPNFPFLGIQHLLRLEHHILTHTGVNYTKYPGSEKNQPRPQSIMLQGREASEWVLPQSFFRTRMDDVSSIM